MVMFEIVIIMLGVSGVGKIIFLILIYEQFSKIKEVNFEFILDFVIEEIF